MDYSPPIPLLIDTDAGVDDAGALMLALASPRGHPLAITTVHGNVPVRQATQNVSLVLDVMGREVPVYGGASRPLLGAPLDASDIMGPDGLGGVTAWMQPSMRQTRSSIAAVALVQWLTHQPEPIRTHLVSLGPLTNLALALALKPDLPRYVARLVIMGGTSEARGNASAVAEFNFFADPEAAARVLGAGFKEVWLLPWETSLRYPIAWAEFDALLQCKNPRTQFLRNITGYLRERLQRLGLPGIVLPDFLAMLVALYPECVQESIPVHASVETEGRLGRGLLAISWLPGGSDPNLYLVTRLDLQMGLEVLRDLLIGGN
ncbi:nucleoside hydrolase [uncultured Thermanaerothrix sp.]|uniref:nucleoside hydrolase n=1 Tax=uncultured Thermanaerothrix sp. TaxID=1195149 RepID=UPI00262A949A|nr:nucleoside hydrolase [uncultured Thermanaerothrix sp.]